MDNPFSIQGQGYVKHTSTDVNQTAGEPDESAAVEGAAADINPVTCPNAESAEELITERLEEYESGRPTLISQLIIVNKNLEQQISTLRFRLDFDSKHHTASTMVLEQKMNLEVNERDHDIEVLASKLNLKDEKISSLETENKQKEIGITNLETQISNMKKDLSCARKYANDLHRELNVLQTTNKGLGKGFAYENKDNEIKQLTQEIEDFKTNMSKMDSELIKAKEVISKQGGKIRLLENDNNNMQVKLRTELAKVTHSMRLEVEKMRDVMKHQWDEMNAMRQQNEHMRSDLKDIKNLLRSSVDLNNEKSERIPVYGRPVFKPTLPTLTRDTKRILTGKRK